MNPKINLSVVSPFKLEDDKNYYQGFLTLPWDPKAKRNAEYFISPFQFLGLLLLHDLKDHFGEWDRRLAMDDKYSHPFLNYLDEISSKAFGNLRSQYIGTASFGSTTHPVMIQGMGIVLFANILANALHYYLWLMPRLRDGENLSLAAVVKPSDESKILPIAEWLEEPAFRAMMDARIEQFLVGATTTPLRACANKTDVAWTKNIPIQELSGLLMLGRNIFLDKIYPTLSENEKMLLDLLYDGHMRLYFKTFPGVNPEQRSMVHLVRHLFSNPPPCSKRRPGGAFNLNVDNCSSEFNRHGEHGQDVTVSYTLLMSLMEKYLGLRAIQAHMPKDVEVVGGEKFLDSFIYRIRTNLQE